VLHLHRAERSDGLVGALSDLLGHPFPDPFAPEVIAVPTRGMERWLTQSLSASLGATAGRADGVCANVDFPFPGRLVGDAVAAPSGINPDEDRWPPERAVWPLLEVVDLSIGEPWLRTLSAHLGDATDPIRYARRLSTVRRLAELFARYALNKPEILRAWARGEDDRWQAELWRRLRERIGQASPSERLEGIRSPRQRWVGGQRRRAKRGEGDGRPAEGYRHPTQPNRHLPPVTGPTRD
jgi:exodeoxyribonuclease V gamma subunit